MKRSIKKQIWVNRKEAQALERKAKKACLTEAALVRSLITGYEPKEKPDDRFYDAMRELSNVGNNLNQLAHQANAYGFANPQDLEREVRKLNQFQSRIEKAFLEPERK